MWASGMTLLHYIGPHLETGALTCCWCVAWQDAATRAASLHCFSNLGFHGEKSYFKLTQVHTPEVLRGSFHVYKATVHQHGRADHYGTVGFSVGRYFGLDKETQADIG